MPDALKFDALLTGKEKRPARFDQHKERKKMPLLDMEEGRGRNISGLRLDMEEGKGWDISELRHFEESLFI